MPGRDLRTPVSGDTHAFGMRRDFEQAKSEQLLDGRLLPVEGVRFYAVREGRLFTGDGECVLADDDPARPLEDASAAGLHSAFAGFATILQGTPVEALENDEVRRALKTLGYGE